MEIPFWLDAYRPSWNSFRLSFYCASEAGSGQSQNMQKKTASLCCGAQQLMSA
ncbi:hypothetical protein [Parasphingorhabdus halotolerans]|uniref:hypothetical protein n=1 Tax=Parasphingorhabdus halotolerans TaxID=2725558 RepID=UPI001B3A79E0|nr:hypothetical protein [Parasphingorhabdus halotolerans]